MGIGDILIESFADSDSSRESTNARVKWWSIFQTGVLIGVCVFQVAYLKRYFG